MNPFRLVALLALAAAAGCYNDAPPQSTFPEPQYVSGPPGGAFDPGSAYQNAGEPDDQSADDIDEEGDGDAPIAAAPDADSSDAADAGDAADAAELPIAAAPDPDGAAPLPPGDELAEAPGDTDPAIDPTTTVTDTEINATLDGYGQWVETDDYGPVWRPDATVVGVDFTPYETGGSWAYTDAGWAFSCDYSWGWLPFHYGRWGWFNGYWGWVPGHRWGPAWVDWRHGGGVVGWRPRPPRPLVRDHRRSHRFGSGALVRDHRRAELHDAHWRFAATSDFSRPHIRSHLYGNLADGLRVTSRVKAPPLRARTTVRAGDLMRNRFAAGSPARIRDHRSGAPPRAFQPPAQGIRQPSRGYPAGRSPNDAYGPRGPGQTYQPPVRDHRGVGPYQPPVRTYDPARDNRGVRTYDPARDNRGVRTYDPARDNRGVRTYQPPVRDHRGGSYQPPVRTYQPPVRTYQPPVRTYQPPVRSAPPVRTYQPPARTYTPAAPPSRSWSPPARSSSPPPRSSPPPSSSSSRSSSSSSNSGSSRFGGSHRR